MWASKVSRAVTLICERELYCSVAGGAVKGTHWQCCDSKDNAQEADALDDLNLWCKASEVFCCLILARSLRFSWSLTQVANRQ